MVFNDSALKHAGRGAKVATSELQDGDSVPAVSGLASGLTLLSGKGKISNFFENRFISQDVIIYSSSSIRVTLDESSYVLIHQTGRRELVIETGVGKFWFDIDAGVIEDDA